MVEIELDHEQVARMGLNNISEDFWTKNKILFMYIKQ